MKFIDSVDFMQKTGCNDTSLLLKILKDKITFSLVQSSKDKLEPDLIDFATKAGWDLNTTLVVWREIQSSSSFASFFGSSPTCICLVFENMDLDELILITKKYLDMKAFL